ncbi:hypothetical protein [Achromobacter ruhlandii]|uniref:hypothetical protein n=1 Tax=Achromobacter ruhlandii TaxID=72557 RepID=UPI0007BF1EB3|nr:hypothetical protein [Achromobacter ruhlandii]
MTNHNNAAQPVLTDDQIEVLAKKHIAPHADRLDATLPNRIPYQQTEQFRRVKALIGDVLSKLRAPVADERAAFKKCHSTIIKALAAIAKADGPDTRHEDDPELLYRSPVMDDVVRIRIALDECSAALASAPVAGEAQERIEQMAVNRYRPVPDSKFSYKVVAGDGSRSLYTGTKDSCLRVAAKLTEAFLDGAFVASDASPQSSKDGEHGE